MSRILRNLFTWRQPQEKKDADGSDGGVEKSLIETNVTVESTLQVQRTQLTEDSPQMSEETFVIDSDDINSFDGDATRDVIWDTVTSRQERSEVSKWPKVIFTPNNVSIVEETDLRDTSYNRSPTQTRADSAKIRSLIQSGIAKARQKPTSSSPRNPPNYTLPKENKSPPYRIPRDDRWNALKPRTPHNQTQTVWNAEKLDPSDTNVNYSPPSKSPPTPQTNQLWILRDGRKPMGSWAQSTHPFMIKHINLPTFQRNTLVKAQDSLSTMTNVPRDDRWNVVRPKTSKPQDSSRNFKEKETRNLPYPEDTASSSSSSGPQATYFPITKNPAVFSVIRKNSKSTARQRKKNRLLLKTATSGMIKKENGYERGGFDDAGVEVEKSPTPVPEDQMIFNDRHVSEISEVTEITQIPDTFIGPELPIERKRKHSEVTGNGTNTEKILPVEDANDIPSEIVAKPKDTDPIEQAESSDEILTDSPANPGPSAYHIVPDTTHTEPIPIAEPLADTAHTPPITAPDASFVPAAPAAPPVVGPIEIPLDSPQRVATEEPNKPKRRRLPKIHSQNIMLSKTHLRVLPSDSEENKNEHDTDKDAKSGASENPVVIEDKPSSSSGETTPKKTPQVRQLKTSFQSIPVDIHPSSESLAEEPTVPVEKTEPATPKVAKRRHTLDTHLPKHTAPESTHTTPYQAKYLPREKFESPRQFFVRETSSELEELDIEILAENKPSESLEATFSQLSHIQRAATRTYNRMGIGFMLRNESHENQSPNKDVARSDKHPETEVGAEPRKETGEKSDNRETSRNDSNAMDIDIEEELDSGDERMLPAKLIPGWDSLPLSKKILAMASRGY